MKHGERLEILEYRHRFAKVRTPEGIEGWADTRQLLTPDQMTELRRMADQASQYPSQGLATTFESLNMHTEPNRVSPSFWQIAENGRVDVIGHKLSPRVAPATQSGSSAPKPKPVRRRPSREKQTRGQVPPPDPPPPPALPRDWLALSVPPRTPAEPAPAPTPAKAPPAPVPMDDWSLVRTKEGKAGWVLTRMLSMAIPDEVAQYAEGHRITSYFALGEQRDGDAVKSDWLWTTITKGGEPYEFDSFRVFVWSHKHHRYETAYIERNVIGHFPIKVDTSGSAPRFSLVIEGNDGQLYCKSYTFEGYRIRMVEKATYQPDAPGEKKPAEAASAAAKPAVSESLYARAKRLVKGWFR